jgi:uncharacterized membrane protein (UPF0127 family)
MGAVRVVNRTRGSLIAGQAEWADTFWSRFLGLMGRDALPAGYGLIIQPGGAIHMFFMRIPLDVLHVDGDMRVTHVLRGIKPWRLGPLFVGGALTIELPAGAADGTEPGDVIAVEEQEPSQ